jgi:hypothetical protein
MGSFLFVLMGLSSIAQAQTRVAVLDFELRDLTLAPGIPSELERTAAVKPMLETQLATAGYQIQPVNLNLQAELDGGVGYLFDHPDVAAQLARATQADFVLVGRLHKPSFLFAYLIVQLVDAKTGKISAHWVVEVKGPQKKLTYKGVESLVVKINHFFNDNRSPKKGAFNTN